MAREELVSSAVTFLRDPSTASAPLQKRIQFLQSKNLTQNEIDLALARAGNGQSSESFSNPNFHTPQQQQQQIYSSQPPQNGPYNPYMEWQTQRPPPLPKRDWRDWFIMATVVSGAGFGLYTLAERYIKPLIAPPTPPQLEQDKAAIDDQFSRAFALLDTLSQDTTALKQAEETRTQRLDVALAEVESVVAELRAASARRDDESRRITDDVRGLQDALPRAVDGAREAYEKRLVELGKELGSLKTLIWNRLGGPGPPALPGPGMGLAAATATRQQASSSSPSPQHGSETRRTTAADDNPATTTATTTTGLPASSSTPTPPLPPPQSSSFFSSSEARPPFSYGPSFPGPEPRPIQFGSTGTGSGTGSSVTAGKAAIPSWQMAAAAKTPRPGSGAGVGGGGESGGMGKDGEAVAGQA
jgi:peroxin-14